MTATALRADRNVSTSNFILNLQSWMKITNLEIIFTGLYQKFDRLSTAWVRKYTNFE